MARRTNGNGSHSAATGGSNGAATGGHSGSGAGGSNGSPSTGSGAAHAEPTRRKEPVAVSEIIETHSAASAPAHAGPMPAVKRVAVKREAPATDGEAAERAAGRASRRAVAAEGESAAAGESPTVAGALPAATKAPRAAKKATKGAEGEAPGDAAGGGRASRRGRAGKLSVKSAVRGGRPGRGRQARVEMGDGDAFDAGADAVGGDGDPFTGRTDERDERAIAQEVALRIRALLTELGLDRVIGGASPREMAAGLAGWLQQLVPAARDHALGSLKNLLSSEYLQPETWKGLLYVAQNAMESSLDSRARRARGDYETDDFGFDEEFFQACLPVTRFLYEKWWRVDVTGLENVPDDKRSLIVANHSGVLPFDGAMISQAIWSHHRSPRPVRWLYLKWFASLPFVSILLSRAGGAMACPENGERLLEQDRLVGVFPEGLKGVGKLFRDRYKLARFGRGGFIKMAMRTRAPIIPVSVVGAEEIYPALTYLEFISKPLGMPMLPITPTFPWLGLLGLVPLPSKWSIHFGTPIRFNENAPAKVDDFLILSLLTEKVRSQIQTQIDDQLKLRKSVFFG